jgi:hypothetical protein
MTEKGVFSNLEPRISNLEKRQLPQGVVPSNLEKTSLRGAQRRGNPDISTFLDNFATLAMTEKAVFSNLEPRTSNIEKPRTSNFEKAFHSNIEPRISNLEKEPRTSNFEKPRTSNLEFRSSNFEKFVLSNLEPRISNLEKAVREPAEKTARLSEPAEKYALTPQEVTLSDEQVRLYQRQVRKLAEEERFRLGLLR